jgi:hypothetical protein
VGLKHTIFLLFASCVTPSPVIDLGDCHSPGGCELCSDKT